MQCSIPPADWTQVAERDPHASLQNASPPTPSVQSCIRQAAGVAPASTSTGVPPPSARSHWLTVPSENSQTLALVQAGVPQQ